MQTEESGAGSRKRPQTVEIHSSADPSNGCSSSGSQGAAPPAKKPAPAAACSDGDEEEEEDGSPSESELEQDLENPASSSSNSTKMSNQWAMRHFTRWREERNITHPEDPVPADLLKRFGEPELFNKWLARYADEARKLDGKPYPASSVYFILAAIARQMRADDLSCPNFLNASNRQFRSFHDSLENTFRRLREEVQPEPRHGKVLTQEEEEQLWASGSLACNSPKNLLRAVYFLNVKYLGLQSATKHRHLQLSQFKRMQNPPRYTYTSSELTTVPDKLPILVRGGAKQQTKKLRTVVLNSEPWRGNRCYVYVLDSYLQRIPPDASTHGTFYLKPLMHGLVTAPNQWYGVHPVGKNSLGRMLKEICADAGIHGARSLKHFTQNGRVVLSESPDLAIALDALSPPAQLAIPSLSFLLQGVAQIPRLPSPSDTPTPTGQGPNKQGGEQRGVCFIPTLPTTAQQRSSHVVFQLPPIAPVPTVSSPTQQSLQQPVTSQRTNTQTCTNTSTPTTLQPTLTHTTIAARTTTKPSTTTSSNQSCKQASTQTSPQQVTVNHPLPPKSLPISGRKSSQSCPPTLVLSDKVPTPPSSDQPRAPTINRQSSSPLSVDSVPTPQQQQQQQTSDSFVLPQCCCPCHASPQPLVFNNCTVTIYVTPSHPPPTSTS